MTNFLTVKEAMKKGKGKVALRGWVYRERKSNALAFIVLRDHTDIIQCVIEKEKVDKKVWNDAEKLLIESSIELEGTIKADKRAPTGFEVHVNKLNVIQISERFPIVKDQSPEFLLDNRHLWLRSRKMVAIMKIRSTVTGAIHQFFRDKGYFEFTPPILQPSQSEGGSTVFEVKYYKDTTYLSQTWQLYAEAAVFALGKIYDVSPTFRAEKSKTSRHLSEFWMAEMEAVWMKLEECSEIAKEEIKFIIKEVLKHNKEDLNILKRDIKLLEHYVKTKYPTITYDEALKILKDKYKMKIPFGKDLRTIEEDKITQHFGVPVVVTHYPTETMAFYKPPEPKNPKTARCFDMLAPEGYVEIVGGSERSLDIEYMSKRLKEMGEDPKNYDWYFDTRKYGSVPHSGYGVGVERVIAWICGLDNIKDAIPFPRTMLRKSP
ncbi:asparagine--tRNA ligase [Candidatus Woesearchaeota archaeon]|nr:asparagine--tRNA ligase [Candidatus Woesearchaeota archaeon]MBW2994104.1 asparagine--tRNA ligase [Candidatus Woesearchaeota archaeon]